MDVLKNFTKINALDILAVLLLALFAYYGLTSVIKLIVRHSVAVGHRRKWHKRDITKRQKTLADLYANVWRVMVVFISCLILFHLLFPAVSTAPLFASAGIIGVALGFGAQSLVKDFISGIFIIGENQYRVGDVVTIGDAENATVVRIGARSTVLRDLDGNVHYIPNGTISEVVNKTMLYSAARFTVSVHPSADIDEIITIINQVGQDMARDEHWSKSIIEAPQFFSIDDFTATSVDLQIRGKTQPSAQWLVVAQMRRRLFAEFDKRHIELAVVPVSLD